MKLQRFLDVSQASSVKELERQLIGFAGELDFGLVNAMLVYERPGSPSINVGIGNMPAGFLAVSGNRDAARRDPVTSKLMRLSVPVIYDQGLYVMHQAADLWEEQAPFGFKTGVAMALHLPRSMHFLIGVDRERPLPKRDDRMTQLLGRLQLLAVHAQEAAVRLMTSPADRPMPRLTPRELQVLQWTMAGKTSWAIGEILNISLHTVHFHLKNVLTKLECTSKHQAVLKAMSLGVL